MTSDLNPVLHWNQVAREIDRGTAGVAGRVTRKARAFAMLHLAMHDAWRACHGGSDAPALAALGPAPEGVSIGAVMGAAAASVLAGLHPLAGEAIARQEIRWNRLLGRGGAEAGSLTAGRLYGVEIGAAMLDPFAPKAGLLDSGWALDAAARAQAGPLPEHEGMATRARPLGETSGMDEASFDLCNRCLETIATGRGLGIADSALLFALAHVAMADAAIAAWARGHGHLAVAPVAGTPGAACFRAAASFIALRFPDDAPLDRYAFDLPDEASGGRPVSLAVGRAANDSDGSRVYLGLPNVIVPHRRVG